MDVVHTTRFKSERLSFPDTGDWWEIRLVLNVALDREYALIALQSQELTGPSDPRVLTLSERTHALLLKCTTGWSYGPVDEATLDNEIPANHYNEVGKRMVTLYSPLVLARIEMLLSASSLPSSQEADGRSPTSSAMPT